MRDAAGWPSTLGLLIWPQDTLLAALPGGANVFELAVEIAKGVPGPDNKIRSSVWGLQVSREELMIRGSLLPCRVSPAGVITETGCDEYRPTSFSKVLTVEKYSDAFPLMDATTESRSETSRFTMGILALPVFLEKTKYRNPTSGADTAFQLGCNTYKGFFGHLQQEHIPVKRFNNHMGVYAQGRARWIDPGFYRVRERLIDGAAIKQDDVLVVDVGGSFGHDLLYFRRKWPDIPGRLVLQDLPEVLSAVKDLHPSIEITAHNFFTEQPVKAARAYYLHSVLQDWPDDLCSTILANLVAAMKPGYSKLLVNENVIPDTGAYWETTSLDLIMMQLGSGERTERHWRSLLESAGLRIVGIWAAHRSVESLIECELA
ncbi:S-adenosyl-L-methionine-dependent methyltransferase [Aspergillus foveolatus]|uniref:S-adenosyl-L-methionine-dependent methyltransferase n=1 Tax=Aspergillus foveolatus TaxID=210207 RepID=UPI003CCD50CE